MEGYDVKHLMPRPESCMNLRTSARLSDKTFQTTTVGLANLLFAVQSTHSLPPNMTLGMGLIVGDGRLFFLAIDVAVLPSHQGNGVGRYSRKS